MLKRSLTVPLGACDSHVHIYGPLDRYPAPENSQYLIPDVGLEELFAVHDLNGFSRSVIVNAAAASPDNRRMLDALGDFPHRLRGIASLPVNGVTRSQLRDWARLGVCGIRISFVGKKVSDLDRHLMTDLADLGWHLQLQVEGNQILEIEQAVHKLACRVVIDHMGRIPASEGVSGNAFQCLLRLVQAGHVWVKLSAPMRYSQELDPPYNDVTEMAQALVSRNPDVLLWGSDWPHVNHKGKTPTFQDLVFTLGHWVSDESILRKILVENPQVLYGFSSQH